MSTFFRIWLAPIVIAVISAAGLLSALTGDDIWDVLSWITLSVPLVVIAYFLNKYKVVSKK
ncbi:hypothetical protein ACFQZS_12395 [Mucilaginibacter calamicampi]|uniref:Uncharacterized protein n=1 Tax=Mucilaginibacter calamicampi TaxID=1302352 RepID=A0ABW2Z2C0_9SPHI